MKWRLLILGLIVLQICASTLSYAQNSSWQNTKVASSDGAINGSVTLVERVNNGKKKGRPLANQPIYLDILDGDRVLQALDTTTDDNGNFKFANLSRQPKTGYRCKVIFDESTYYSTVRHFVGDINKITLNVETFNSTSEKTALKAEAVQVIVYAEDGEHLLRVEESIVLHNTSDTLAYYSNEGLQIKLPNNLYRSEVPVTADYKIENDTLIYNKSLPPGSGKQFDVMMHIPRKLSKLTFEQSLPVPIIRQAVFLNPPSLEYQGPLRLAGQKIIGNIDYKIFVSEQDNRLTDNTRVYFQVHHIPGGFGVVHWSILIAFVIVLLTAILFVKKQSDSKSYRLTIMQLKTLDEEFRSGNIPEKAYKRLRARLGNDIDSSEGA